MSRQGSRAPIGLGIGGAVIVLGLGAWAATHLLPLRDIPRALAAPVTLFERGTKTHAPSRAAAPTTAPAPRIVTPPNPAPQQSPATVAPLHTDLTPDVLFARSLPAVVRINVHDGAMKPLGHGSGFFVSGDGLVVTNCHVIDGANYATVERSDGTVLRVEGVAAMDREADLVLLKVTADEDAFPTLALGPDALPRVGTKVYAIGHPLGLKNVLSEGLVSSLGDPAQGQRFIQTTAAISPGSSGGPLMTADGVVVGVTTATVREAQNMNFAMPAGRVRWLLDQPRADKPSPLVRATRSAPASTESTASLERAIDRVWDALRMDKLNDAAHQVEQLRERGKDNAYYWFTCGCVHTRLHNDDLAVEAFQASLKLKPDKLPTYLNLGQVYVRQGKLKEAIATFEAAAKVDPSDPRVYAEAGQAYVQGGQPERAVPFYQRALRLQPRNATFHRNLGVAYSALGQLAESLESLQKAVELEPGVAEHHRNVGVTLVDLRRYPEALKELQKAVSLKPDNAEAYLFLGYAYYHLANRPAAMDAWRNADRFDAPTGKTGQFARKAMSQCAAGKEVTPFGHK